MDDLRWREPSAYRRAIYYFNERARPLESLKVAAGSFVLFLGLRALAGVNPPAGFNPPAWGAVAVAGVLFGALIAYGLPALMSLLPGPIVILSDKGINHNKQAGLGWTIRFWPWESIASVEIGTDEMGGREYAVMELAGHGGEILAVLALGQDVSIDAVQQRLAANGMGDGPCCDQPQNGQ